MSPCDTPTRHEEAAAGQRDVRRAEGTDKAKIAVS
jgi:hypothetical protein